ncbi:MAG: 1-deoxy-D-xylulose-5-phosphate reductoisomerase [Deltaproteobacteria bacterium RBG_16_64_85]|nr:MAG: 1-deoxy-D-xylulose-5-phosphate reductoisomerase [Deltaproteobacteria bacterium RBG_16_64_85]
MSARKGVAVLGSTGSVGRSALDVIARFPGRFRVTALCAGKNASRLGEQARRFRPSLVCLAEERSAAQLGRLPRGTRVVFGEQGMTEAVCADAAGIVLAAASGVSSIRPVIAAATLGKRIALANKELLVMAGRFLVKAARAGGAEILPVDSEHSAVFQAASGHRREDILRILLTASGGPFRNHTLRRMRRATVSEVLGHPTWRMGTKITVDSATLMNKGLEVIEATWLFGLPPSKIDVLIHPQSVVHSIVEYRDGSMIAQFGVPDMRIPIGYALSYPERLPLELPRFKPHRMDGWTFEPPDRKRFPALSMAYAAAEAGGTAPAVLSAGNEVAVDAFLSGRIRFTEIVEVVGSLMAGWRREDRPVTLADVLRADARAREMADLLIPRKRSPRR